MGGHKCQSLRNFFEHSTNRNYKPHLIRSHLIKWREGLSSQSPIKKSGINDMTVVIVLELFAEGILIGGGIFKRGGLTGMVIQMPALSQSLQNIWSVLIKLD